MKRFFVGLIAFFAVASCVTSVVAAPIAGIVDTVADAIRWCVTPTTANAGEDDFIAAKNYLDSVWRAEGNTTGTVDVTYQTMSDLVAQLNMNGLPCQIKQLRGAGVTGYVVMGAGKTSVLDGYGSYSLAGKYFTNTAGAIFRADKGSSSVPSTSAPHISENNSSPGSGSSGGYIPSHFGKNTEKEILQQIAQYTHEIWFWADLINDNLKDVRRYTHMVYANIGRFVDGMNNITTGIYKQIDLLSGYLPRLDDIYNRLFNIQSASWASVDVENRIYSAVAGLSPCLDILSEISATLNNYFALTMQKIPEEYSDLPVGYTEVEYIESTGGQYIDTGYSAGNTTSISMSFSDLVPSSEYSMLFGAANSSGGVPFGNRIVYHANDKKFSIGVSDAFMMFDAFEFHSRADILFSNSGSSFSLMVRGSEPRSLTGSFSGTFPDATLYIFTQNDMGRPDGSFAAMRLYSFAILADGVPVRNFLPCIDPAGSVGLYDLIYNKFYPNLGSGVFVAGAEVHRYHYNYESFLQKSSVNLDSFLSGFTVTADLTEVTTRLDSILAELHSTSGSASCEHTYDQHMEQDADCTLPGLMISTCSKCGDSYSEIVDPLGHDWVISSHVDAVTDPETGKETASAYDVYTCSRCGRTYEDHTGDGAPDEDYSNSTISQLAVKVFSKLGTFAGKLIGFIVHLFDKAISSVDEVISKFNDYTAQISGFGGDYPTWLTGFWVVLPVELQTALTFALVCMVLGVVGKKLFFS